MFFLFIMYLFIYSFIMYFYFILQLVIFQKMKGHGETCCYYIDV